MTAWSSPHLSCAAQLSLPPHGAPSPRRSDPFRPRIQTGALLDLCAASGARLLLLCSRCSPVWLSFPCASLLLVHPILHVAPQRISSRLAKATCRCVACACPRGQARAYTTSQRALGLVAQPVPSQFHHQVRSRRLPALLMPCSMLAVPAVVGLGRQPHGIRPARVDYRSAASRTAPLPTPTAPLQSIPRSWLNSRCSQRLLLGHLGQFLPLLGLYRLSSG